MSSELQSFLAFLEEQKARQASHFPGLKVPKVLSFMGTTSLPGSYAACSVHHLRAIERGASARDLRVVLGGATTSEWTEIGNFRELGASPRQ